MVGRHFIRLRRRDAEVEKVWKELQIYAPCIGYIMYRGVQLWVPWLPQEAFVARISPDTRHCDACVPPWADAALHLERKFMKLHAALRLVRTTLHSVMTSICLQVLCWDNRRQQHMPFQDHVAWIR